MAKTQDIKRRIKSIGNTRQLTRAMKMVSAAKLRRAQERIIKARPYAHSILRLLRSLVVQAICPDPMPLKLVFKAEVCGKHPPGIVFEVNAADEAMVTFRATEVL